MPVHYGSKELHYQVSVVSHRSQLFSVYPSKSLHVHLGAKWIRLTSWIILWRGRSGVRVGAIFPRGSRLYGLVCGDLRNEQDTTLCLCMYL